MIDNIPLSIFLAVTACANIFTVYNITTQEDTLHGTIAGIILMVWWYLMYLGGVFTLL